MRWALWVLQHYAEPRLRGLSPVERWSWYVQWVLEAQLDGWLADLAEARDRCCE